MVTLIILIIVCCLGAFFICSIGSVFSGIFLFVNRIIATIKNRSDKLRLKIAAGVGSLALAAAGVGGTYISARMLWDFLHNEFVLEVFDFDLKLAASISELWKKYSDNEELHEKINQKMLILFCGTMGIIIISAAIIVAGVLLMVRGITLKRRAAEQGEPQSVSSKIMIGVGFFLIASLVVTYSILIER